MSALRQGPLYVWLVGGVGLFVLYILFSFITPMIGTIANNVDSLWYQLGTNSGPWYEMWMTWNPTLANFMGYLNVAYFVAFLIWIVVNSGRRSRDIV